MTKLETLARMTEPQRRAIRNLTAEPQAAKRGGPWSALAAFNLVRWGYVRLHQSYRGDRYSLTHKGIRARQSLSQETDNVE